MREQTSVFASRFPLPDSLLFASRVPLPTSRKKSRKCSGGGDRRNSRPPNHARPRRGQEIVSVRLGVLLASAGRRRHDAADGFAIHGRQSAQRFQRALENLVVAASILSHGAPPPDERAGNRSLALRAF